MEEKTNIIMEEDIGEQEDVTIREHYQKQEEATEKEDDFTFEIDESFFNTMKPKDKIAWYLGNKELLSNSEKFWEILQIIDENLQSPNATSNTISNTITNTTTNDAIEDLITASTIGKKLTIVESKELKALLK